MIPKNLFAVASIAMLGAGVVLYVNRGEACGDLRCDSGQVCELGLCVCPAGDQDCTGKVLCNVDPLATCPTSPENPNICAHCPDETWICVAKGTSKTCCYAADRKSVRACGHPCNPDGTCDHETL